MALSQLSEYLKGRKQQGFRAVPYYSKDGDFLTYYFENRDHCSERIDDTLTVYIGMDEGKDSQEIVGFKLKGVARLLEELGDFCLHVARPEDKASIGLLFLVGMQFTPPDVVPHYQRMASRTKHVPLPAEANELELCCGAN